MINVRERLLLSWAVGYENVVEREVAFARTDVDNLKMLMRH